MSHQVIIDFWFKELTSKDWWGGGPELDALVRERFSGVFAQAFAGELFSWRRSVEGRLAEILVLDQFPRNMFRGLGKAFSADGVALVLAQEFIAGGYGATLPPQQRAFAYMPLMHSESLAVHRAAVAPFSEPGLEHNLKFLYNHTEVIERFGRYPSRNKALGRVSTPEEEAFLINGPTWGQG